MGSLSYTSSAAKSWSEEGEEELTERRYTVPVAPIGPEQRLEFATEWRYAIGIFMCLSGDQLPKQYSKLNVRSTMTPYTQSQMQTESASRLR